jgi:3-methylfumaryl-CoA hydratase
MDDAAYQSWVGRWETAADIAAPGPLARLAALLDHDQPPWPAGSLPPLAHWLYFLPSARQSLIDADGHPQRGGLLPPVPLPRRMWAGGRLRFIAPIAIGAAMTRRSTVLSVVPKAGKSGQMVFVTLRHEVFCEDRLAVSEEQDIVYRERASAGSAAAPAAPVAAIPFDARRAVMPDPVLLFRFSALTFNAHRIHYDRDYARDVESYQGLVVHGPLIATLLVDHYLRHHPGQPISRFQFRAQNPLFDTAPFSLFLAAETDRVNLWAAEDDKPVAMTAAVEAG